MRLLFGVFSILLLTATQLTSAKEIKANEVHVASAPEWLKQTRMEKVINRIQTKLEWTIRRVELHWYATQEEFAQVHSFGSLATAVTTHTGGTSTIHLGPRVTDKNFDEVFGHELVHVISNQKYKGSIPKWLEEGLANHLSAAKKVDYRWLAKQPFPADVHDLAHPFKGSADGVVYRYKASQALAEMLNGKCNLENLIRLSVQRKMENYIETYCEIKDLNKAFQDWVKKRG